MTVSRSTSLAPRLVSLALLGAFGLGLGFGGCTLANPNHCFNLSVDPNAWCAAVYPDERPYCSPCEADRNGCVVEEPDPETCPGYTMPATESDTGATDTETDTGETDTGETETGTSG